jgi:hypothetical protein
MGKFFRDTQYVFTLEPYDNGTTDPSVVTKNSNQVDMTVTSFLLSKPDFSKTVVVKVQVYTIVLLLITGK